MLHHMYIMKIMLAMLHVLDIKFISSTIACMLKLFFTSYPASFQKGLTSWSLYLYYAFKARL